MRWGFFRKNREPEAGSAGAAPAPDLPSAEIDDELAFLRSRPDFDEEEMASVSPTAGPVVTESPRDVREPWQLAAEAVAALGERTPVAPRPFATGTTASAAPAEELTEEDRMLGALLAEAMGLPGREPEVGSAQVEASPSERVTGEVLAALVPEWADEARSPADLLDLALERGENAGLIPDRIDSQAGG
ncbi:MAG: hypothetical protein ACK47B_06825 [Armatimonadota bacterium]